MRRFACFALSGWLLSSAVGCAQVDDLGDLPASLADGGFSFGAAPGFGGSAGFQSFAGSGPGTGGVTSSGGAGPSAGGANACAAGKKLCAGSCVDFSPTNGCANDCTPCPAPPAHSSATCNGASCFFTCDTGYQRTATGCDPNPSCTDGKKNETETDIDCGGGNCPKCDTGSACKGDSDCSQGPCVSDKCTCAPKTCADVTGCPAAADDGCGKTLDCSGTCASPAVCYQESCCTPKCGAKACGTAADDGCGGTMDCSGSCTGSDVCYQDQCCTPQGCGTRCGQQQDCDKTLDCGACDGSACVLPTDCQSKFCLGGVCVSCKDGKMNNGETDVDCGGPNCGKCPKGKKCAAAADCATNTCCPAPNLNCFLQPDGTCQ
ncbi:MAG TPA: hypothetical protein VHE30_01320 [Polyangiaceae bacterium]|nr:hypothetical protein [Polyangiaceae bacterium]